MKPVDHIAFRAGDLLGALKRDALPPAPRQHLCSRCKEQVAPLPGTAGFPRAWPATCGRCVERERLDREHEARNAAAAATHAKAKSPAKGSW